MVNLLFISNSPRAELLRVHFQQILKIRIDVVEDFDHGLKDVFEKRPVAVCIQDHIAGVTGESVARHIQLLLGNGAPSFVLMHEGNAKARQVPGLFTYLVDLNGSFEATCESLGQALQALLGDQWDTVYNAPPDVESPKSASAAKSLLADQLVDEFIEEGFDAISLHNSRSAPVDKQKVKPQNVMVFEHDLPGGPAAEPHAARAVPTSSAVSADSEFLEAPVPRDPLMAGKQPPAFLQQPAIDHPVRPVQQHEALVMPSAQKEPKTTNDSSVPVEALLQVFEEKYRSRKRMLRWGVGALLLLLIGALLVWMKQRGTFDNRVSNVVKQNLPSRPQQSSGVQPQLSAVRLPASASQPVVQKADSLPSFISKAKPDPAFSKKKPGWSRYLTGNRDYRLFHAESRLRAVQVIAINDSSIPQSELKLVLRDLTGKEQYRPGRQERKGGIWLERATFPGQADLLIYRSTSNGPIKAVVFAPTP